MREENVSDMRHSASADVKKQDTKSLFTLQLVRKKKSPLVAGLLLTEGAQEEGVRSPLLHFRQPFPSLTPAPFWLQLSWLSDQVR